MGGSMGSCLLFCLLFVMAFSPFLHAAAGPGPSLAGSSLAGMGAPNSRTTLVLDRFTLSILTTFMHPATKYGIWSPARRPSSAAPNPDRTEIRARSDVRSSGQTNCTVFSTNAPTRPVCDPRPYRNDRFNVAGVIRHDVRTIDFRQQEHRVRVTLLHGHARELLKAGIFGRG